MIAFHILLQAFACGSLLDLHDSSLFKDDPGIFPGRSDIAQRAVDHHRSIGTAFLHGNIDLYAGRGKSASICSYPIEKSGHSSSLHQGQVRSRIRLDLDVGRGL